MADTPRGSAACGEHNLPMLRVHRAWEAAEKIAEAHGVDQGVALAIARKAIDIIGDGTVRWGHLCVSCRTLLERDGNDLVCPTHGRLGAMGSAVLLISFDPIVGV